MGQIPLFSPFGRPYPPAARHRIPLFTGLSHFSASKSGTNQGARWIPPLPLSLLAAGATPPLSPGYRFKGIPIPCPKLPRQRSGPGTPEGVEGKRSRSGRRLTVATRSKGPGQPQLAGVDVTKVTSRAAGSAGHGGERSEAACQPPLSCFVPFGRERA